uniref:Ofd1_CTDD domain-containing protein n=1 Tax=Heterorhabditis bacteriophora TaxID=37862 RepID=A0A1I7WV45_HETBA
MVASRPYDNIFVWCNLISDSYVNNRKLNSIYRFRPDFDEEGIVEDIETELQEFLYWNRKENDLYSLYQTKDFKSLSPVEHPALISFRQFMCGKVHEWLKEISGIDLLPQVDINGSCYSFTDGLLPHSDQISTRHFAFVYYVTPFIWKQSYGGYLNLYNANGISIIFTIFFQLIIFYALIIYCSLSLSRVQKGCYSVVGDEDVEQSIRDGYALDIHLFICDSSWIEDSGGDIIYVGKDEEEEARIYLYFIHSKFSPDNLFLIRICPEPNCFAVVLREPEVFSFLKYVNSKAKGDFYLFTLTYYHVKMDDSDDGENED